jgi:hypothetical protein
MADAKHSPGPWKSHPIERRQGLPYVPVSAETLIARVYSKHFGDDAQAAANGRLIAAAPELLEALRETWRVIEQAGLLNLARGVQLGNTVWLVKASDAQQLSDRAIVKAVGVGS